MVMAVSDRRQFGTNDEKACELLVIWAALVARAGVDLIQIRERGLDDRQLLALVRRVCAATRVSPTRVIVNERTDVACAAGARGVHLPAVAPAASRVRAIVPSDFVIGRSVHSDVEAASAERDGDCDYVTFGTVFPSPSKPADLPVAGVSALAAICGQVTLPVVAIGGVDVDRAEVVARAGAAGVAAIGLFARPMLRMMAGEPEPVTQSHLEEIVQALRRAFDVASSAAARPASR